MILCSHSLSCCGLQNICKANDRETAEAANLTGSIGLTSDDFELLQNNLLHRHSRGMDEDLAPS